MNLTTRTTGPILESIDAGHTSVNEIAHSTGLLPHVVAVKLSQLVRAGVVEADGFPLRYRFTDTGYQQFTGAETAAEPVELFTESRLRRLESENPALHALIRRKMASQV